MAKCPRCTDKMTKRKNHGVHYCQSCGATKDILTPESSCNISDDEFSLLMGKGLFKKSIPNPELIRKEEKAAVQIGFY